MRLLTEMKPHQVDCVNKLIRLKVSALYMEMGTGKSRCIIEMAYRRFKAGKITHVLWFCPCSVKKSLERELLKHLDDISFITICGIETLSSSDRTFLALLDLVAKETVYIVVDESNLIKNPDAKRTERITRIASTCAYKSILNGTPVSRNEADLFAQWYLLDWRILGYKSYSSFSRNHIEYDMFGKARRVLEVAYLTEKIAPFTYQVKLNECVTLTERTDYTAYTELTNEQRGHMRDVGAILLEEVDEWRSESIYRLLMGLYAVSSGYYFDIIGEQVDFSRKTRMFLDPRENPRMKKLLSLIEKYEYDEKIIIYFNTTSELEEVLRVLRDDYGEESAVRFDGEVSIKERDVHLELFETSARFLLANKACGAYGLNLQFARIAIFYSQDWDWATKEQACARIHRIGQEKPVEIINIECVCGIDARISQNLSRKTDLVDELKGSIDKLKDLLIEPVIAETRDAFMIELERAAKKRDAKLQKERDKYFRERGFRGL